MEIKDISQGGKSFYELEEDGKTWNTSNSLEKIGKEKLKALENAIEEIEKLVKEREELSKAINQEAEKIKIEVNNFLAEHKPVDSDALKESVMLKQKQVEISELQLKEKVSCWQDIAKLKEELREKEKELSEKKGRLNMLDKIMEE